MGKKSLLSPTAVDLFCGAGGLSYGLKRAGVKISAGIDIDPTCKYPFETNVKSNFYEMDVVNIDAKFIKSLFPRNSVHILAGCAPCQPFSCYSHGKKSDMWSALSKFGSLINGLYAQTPKST